VDIEIRPIGPEEFEAYTAGMATAFSEYPREEWTASERRVAEYERTFGALDGGTFIGGTSTVSFRLTVPGGEVGMAGVTGVGVAPTHRRRGVARELMRRQLDHVRELGTEPLAGLYSSESSIYGRFGYGPAVPEGRFDIERDRTGFLPSVASRAGQVRLMERARALEAMAPVHDAVRPRQPGMLAREGEWWDVWFEDFESDREGFSAYFFAIHEGIEGVDAYAVYRFKHEWVPDGLAKGIVEVIELIATTPEAHAAMWRYVFDLDLAGSIRANHRPIDDPLFALLADPRRLRFSIRDGLWLRVVDVSTALASRRYATEDRLVLDVRDDFCAWNEGRYELEGGPEGATCRRTEAEPDLRLSAAELGSVYLGGLSPGQLGRAGRVDEDTPGALRRASTMFSWDPAPWCPQGF
jgi:predicted acetyltransferase